MGIAASLKSMLNEGGLRSMWRGNGVSVLKNSPEFALKFAAYEKIKRIIRGDEERQMTISERFVAGACAGMIGQTIIHPMDVLKTRITISKTGQYSSITNAVKKIYTREGIRSFYRGYLPSIIGTIPYNGTELAVYETLKKKYLIINQNTEYEQPNVLVHLACGSVSSTLGQVCSYPLALVRTRLQAQVVLTSHVSATADTMLDVFKRIIRTEGVFGLYRGLTPNFVKALPAASIYYVVYEYTSRQLGINMT